MKGYIQVYTGNGKGKTTAALGLAIRAAGCALRVFIAQFAKKRICGEHIALKRFNDLITIKRYGSEKFIKGKPSKADIRIAQKGLKEVSTAIASGRYDMVILDEANDTAAIGLISVENLVELIDSKPDAVELVITGRNAHKNIIRRADLVTEMREVKHYYRKGIGARKGIEY
jgi:cob(I)alamin adenosyltransferase